MFKQIKKHWYLYALLCENNKYYIGVTLDLTKRIDTHFRQLSHAAIFCKKHKPTKPLDRKDLGLLTQQEAELIENIETCNYIDKYGFDNVCGGCFSPANRKGYNEAMYKTIRVKEAILFTKYVYKKGNSTFIELESGKKYKLYPIDKSCQHHPGCNRIYINQKPYTLGESITKAIDNIPILNIPIDIKNFIETYNQFHKDDCSGFDNDKASMKGLSAISQLKK